MIIGDPQLWKDRFITIDERLLTRILHLWAACLAPLPQQPDEDSITINLVHLLGKDPVVRSICHWVEYQYEPFGVHPNGARFSKGIIDLAVLLDWERETYLPYECKRLNVVHSGSRNSLATPYIGEGLIRFVTEQYAEGLPLGFMLGYVIDGDLPFALRQIHAAIDAQKVSLLLTDGPNPGAVVQGIERFATSHQRASKSQIEVRHVLLPFPTVPSGVSMPPAVSGRSEANNLGRVG
ncbi:hypothetical protein [Bradyrhizobium sp.]|uniref:hypothetical protein n=1 Tax=Bradyrhizobium sp. TaxID=376 RepID=UPI0026211EE9|nr:hypothetical protein [Bradyrhizobium sp.]